MSVIHTNQMLFSLFRISSQFLDIVQDSTKIFKPYYDKNSPLKVKTAI